MEKTIPYEGKNYRVFMVYTEFGSHDVICVPTTYSEGDSLAIQLFEVENDMVQDSFTVLTVKLGNPFLQTDTRAFVDTNNNPWAGTFIRNNKLGKKTGYVQPSGYCTYPLYEFNLERFTV